MKRKDELEQKKSNELVSAEKITFLGSVFIPSLVITLIKALIEFVARIPGSGSLKSILIENAILFAMLMVAGAIVYAFLKRKVHKLDSAPQVNSFLPGASIEKFRPIEMRTPSEYPIHPEFIKSAKSLKGIRYLILFSTGGMFLLTTSSMLMGMSITNIIGFLCILAMLVLPVFYINIVLRFLEESLREDSFHLAHSEIFELEMLSLSRDYSQQHMMYKLGLKMGNIQKNFHVRPLKSSEKNFSELGLQSSKCPQTISVHINPLTGEPIALATQNGVVWLSNAEIRPFFFPPRPGAKMLTMARPLVPLDYNKGIKLIAEKGSNAKFSSANDKFVGTWHGLYCFEKSQKAQYSFDINLVQSPDGGLSGTFSKKFLGPLYGKITIDGIASGNELYLNVVYHFWLWKWFEKPELWAGIYDPEKSQITGTFKKSDLTGTFVLSRDSR